MKTKHNPKWPYIPDDPYIILIIGGPVSRKINAWLNLINNQLDTFFLSAFSFTTIHESQDCRGRGRAFL